MAYNLNILDPPEGLTPSQRKRWIDSFKWYRTMINGEDFWDDYFGRSYRSEYQAYEFNTDESLPDAEEDFWREIGCPN